MPTIEANPPLNAVKTCPLCGATLTLEHPDACPRCDWVAEMPHHHRKGTFRDRASVCLSVIPGLGHIYKGHRLTGALYMLGAAFAIFAAIVASTATAGFGILLLPLYWVGVMMQVYWLEDLGAKPVRRRH